MNNRVKNIAVTGMFAAMIYVLTMFVKVPLGPGYVHFGDAMLYVCAMLMGAPWACIAGAIGEGLADVTGGFGIYFPATALIKVLISLPFIYARKDEKILSKRSALMTLPAGIITVIGYYIFDAIVNKAYAFTFVVGNIIQAFGSAVIFIAVAAALDKTNIRNLFD